MAVSAELFKAGMRRLAASVTIIATTDGSERAGLTATAVMSLTAEPPLLGAAVNRSASGFPMLAATGIFAVNMLSEDQAPLAVAFSTGGDAVRRERFASDDWSPAVNGAPMLAGTPVSFACRVHQRVELSTHVLFIGLVEEIRLAEGQTTLLHSDGAWAGLVRLLDR